MAHGGESGSEDDSAAGGSGGPNSSDASGDKLSGTQNSTQGAASTVEGFEEEIDASGTDSKNVAGAAINSPLCIGHRLKINLSFFKSEIERLKTFHNWPLSSVDKEKLAAAGFVYYWGKDIVKCVFCETEIGQWASGDEPFEEHKKWAPNCPFLSEYHVGNIPIDETKLPIKPHKTRPYDTCGPFGMNVPASRKRHGCEPLDGLSEAMEKLGILYSSKPLWPEYVTFDARLKTYDNWPIAMKQEPDKLSEAGFFYTGKGDQTLCFHCGKGLRYWEEQDDPWIQHAVWFPHCGFLVMSKGKAFVDYVLQNKERLSTAEGQADIAKELSQVLANRKDADAAAAKTSEAEEDIRLCKICGEKERGLVFLPCGHVIACVDCGPEFSTCPDCNVEISAKMRAHIA